MPIKEIIQKLRKAGHKVTPQRVTIIKNILDSQELLTPGALYDKVRQTDPKIGEVTVYRTLNILSEMGLVCIINSGENTHRYISRPAEHHGHLICAGCGKVHNFTNCNVKDIEKQLTSETGFQIEDHRLDFYGRCRECAAKYQA
jgi:Fur family transcriptional regulator, ferric uptake regulator